ncbi:hypothetical protein FNV43_RR24674 [Rhamnella rubrinervis]|uniref:Uncharacterized protein n=1 Tax=Rhamnella rubrinervis TaxID=2594499 RepID=A0A8K0GLF5_9ROSA|nr:hypothetical protein FNV43_RR24674 [Rhamnella rubrinervis]
MAINKICNTSEVLPKDSTFYSIVLDAQLEEPMLKLPPFRVKDLLVIKTRNLEDFYALISCLLVEEATSISWLNKQTLNAVLYVNFGNLETIKEIEFLKVAWGIANNNQPFMWIVSPWLVFDSKWLEPSSNGFMEMVGSIGEIVKWAP